MTFELQHTDPASDARTGLITTDHGGTGGSHGGPSFEERMTFIVSNKDILSVLGA